MKFDLRKNLSLKLLSLFVAMILWVVVAGEEDIVKDFALPLELTNIPSSLEISGPVVDTVLVRLRAPEAILRTLTVDRMAARLDLKDAAAGRIPFRLTTDQIRIPSGSEIVRIQPETIELNLEPKRQKKVRVHPEVAGDPAEGFEVAHISVLPPTIWIEGPESELLETETATTGQIPLRGDETGNRSVSVNPVPMAPANSRVRVLDPAPVLVTIEIREKTDRASFNQIPVRVVGGPYRTQVSPTFLQITLEGPISLIRRILASDILVEVSVEKLLPRDEDYRVEPQVVFPRLSPDEARRLSVTGMSQTFVNIKVYDQRSES